MFLVFSFLLCFISQSFSYVTTEWNILPAPFNQMGASSVYTLGYRVFITGYTINGTEVHIYSQTNKTWKTATLSKSYGQELSGAATETKLFLYNANGLSSVLEVYDSNTDLWSTETLTPKRQGAALVATSQRLFVAGGWSGSSTLGVVDIYDNVKNKWTIASLSQPRWNLCATWTSQFVIFAGGQNLDVVVNNIDIYDLVSEKWTTATLSVPHVHMACTSSEDGTAYFAGGDTEFPTFLNPTLTRYTEVIDVFHPPDYDKGTPRYWSTTSLSSARTRPSVSSIGDLILFVGGSTKGQTAFTKIVEILNTSSNTWNRITLNHTSLFRLPSAATATSTFILQDSRSFSATPVQIDVFNVHCGNGTGECDDGNDKSGDGCSSECQVEDCWICTKTYPSECFKCCSDWQPVEFPGSGPKFCTGCSAGDIFLVRVLFKQYPQCRNVNFTGCSVQPCSTINCISNQSNTQTKQFYFLSREYLFLLFQSLNITTNFVVTTVSLDEVRITFPKCDSSVNMTYISSIIAGVVKDFFANFGFYSTYNAERCLIIVRRDPKVSYYYYVAVIAVIIPVLLAFILYRYYYGSKLHLLPKEISWSFLNKKAQPWYWRHHDGFYTRVYDKGSIEWQKVETILTSYFKSGTIKPTKIKAIYNESLIHSFISQFTILQTRRKTSPEIFFKKTYKENGTRSWVMEQFNIIAAHCVWNYNEVPILPALHGTDAFIAEKIAQTGFAALSSLDAGYFGRGIYFTTILHYSLPYCCGKKNPAIIVTYLNLGNIYPVIEDHKGPKKLVGCAIKAGYNSHFVITNTEGSVYDQEKDQKSSFICNEIVIPQESQILPAFIVEFDKESLRTEFEKWVREIPSYVDEMSHHDPHLDQMEKDRRAENENSDSSQSIFDGLFRQDHRASEDGPSYFKLKTMEGDDYDYRQII